MKISRLILYTTNLKAQTDFYKNVLNVEVLQESVDTAELKFGESILEFKQNTHARPYHFAINIPSFMEAEALTWLKQRVEILKHHGDEIVDFVNWNAKSIYFYDKDKNIVELIARRNLNLVFEGEFNAEQFLEISEIGLAVNEVSRVFEHLNLMDEVPLYFGNLDWFCAAGDEHGLCIIINKNRKGWMPTDDEAFTADCMVRGDLNFNFINGKIIDTFL